MKQGSYGVCEGCSGAIPIARLNALPYATLCIECQRAAEDGVLRSPDDDWTGMVNGGYTDVSMTDYETP